MNPFREELISHLRSVRLLFNLGWQVIEYEVALRQRGNRPRNVILESVLTEWLRENNEILYKGRVYPFTEGNITAAVQALKSVLDGGLIRTNEKIYDLLCLPKSLSQSIDGDTRSYDLHYIDWKHPERNVYHLVEEFNVERAGSLESREPDAGERNSSTEDGYGWKHENTRRPDIVLFVNGIPLVVIECKRPDIKDALEEAVSQQIRNQRRNEIPHLFHFAQILIALAGSQAKYGTVGTPAAFWSVWKEREWTEADEVRLRELISRDPPVDRWARVLAERSRGVKQHFEDYGAHEPTEQDRTLYGLCRPERLLEMIYRFIVFDAGEKKVARYQQYFCVQKAMDRLLSQRDPESGGRKGGVVWHTQGSGKSLTMVMLAKAIALHPEIRNPRIVLVTDRVDLDDQIYGTFHACGLEPVQAQSGKHLGELLADEKTSVVTTIIDKFDTVVEKRNYRNEDDNIFVLVDESHRTQHGRVKGTLFGERAKKMRQALPKACYLGFTGTPLMKREKSTALLFGGLIDSYPITQAVEDKAVVPLLYEGRDVRLKVDRNGIDTWFDRVTENLTKEQKADLKKKFATTGQLQKADQLVRCIAWDVAIHYRDTWKGTGFKGQLVAPDKDTALRYQEYLRETGMVTTEVLISGPDTRKGHEEVEGATTNRVNAFWERTVGKEGRFPTEEAYNKAIIRAFKQAEEPEIIIVVSKLLTGFDAPRNTVLYLARRLEGHALLQAIARVNRVYEGKDFGYILDYVGVLGDLDKAMDLYGHFSEFDTVDLAGTVTDMSEYVGRLPQKHSDLWEIFKEIKNRKDIEAFELLLGDEAIRARFYERLSDFARTLQVSLSSVRASEQISSSTMKRYRADLKFFENLRRSVRQRYAEQIDFKEYESRIRALVDRHVGADEVQEIVPLVSIFDQEAFQQEVEKLGSDRSRADTIASRTHRTIRERWDEDPAFYRRFSEMLAQVIADFHAHRLSDAEYLKGVRQVMNSVLHRTGDQLPEELRNHEVAKAFFGLLQDAFEGVFDPADQFRGFAVEASLGIEQRIRERSIVNWTANRDVINGMKQAIEEFVLDELCPKFEIEPDFDLLDELMEKCIEVAKVRIPDGTASAKLG